MTRCGREPFLRVFAVPADPGSVKLPLPIGAVSFTLRARTAVGMKLRLFPEATEFLSIDAAQSLASDQLSMTEEVELHLSGASATTAELFGWLA